MRNARPLAVLVLLAASHAVALDASDAIPPPAPVADPGPTQSAIASAASLEQLLRNVERDEQAAKHRLGEIERESALSHARAIARGRSYVRLVRAGLLPVGAGFDQLVEHAARLERLYRGLSSDLERERKLVNERRVLTEKLEALRLRREPLESEQKLLASAQTAMLAEEERRTAFESAFSPSDGAHTAVYGAGPGPADPVEVTGGFASLKGRLPFPIQGRSEIHSSRRAGSDGPGLEMRASVGTVVRAVFPGRVAFADAYAEYGNTVIIDHGSRYYTVSAGLGGIDVRVGEEVSSGERIGTVGKTASGALLYFEMRVGNDTVDPAEWLGI